jgi:hypothetical protein
VTRDDASLLVVTSGVAGQLKDFSGEVLHDGGQVDGGASTDALGVVALAEKAVDTADGELESSPVGAGLALSLDFASLATSRHDECFVEVDGSTCEKLRVADLRFECGK